MATTKPDGKSGSSAPQRSDTQALTELNQRSAGLGIWEVGIFYPTMYHWTWTPKGNVHQKSGTGFRCTFVSLMDPSQYVNAQIIMRSDNMAPLEQAEAKFT